MWVTTNNLVKYTKKKIVIQENAKLGPSNWVKNRYTLVWESKEKGFNLAREDLECIQEKEMV